MYAMERAQHNILGKDTLEPVLFNLLDWGTDLTQKDTAGFYPMDYAVKYGFEAVFDTLLAKDALGDPARQLPICIANGHFDLAEKIILRGFDVNKRTNFDRTALHYAAKYDKIELCLLLIRNGADPNMKDVDDHYPLHYAFDTNTDIALIAMLLESGADLVIRDHPISALAASAWAIYLSSFTDSNVDSSIAHTDLADSLFTTLILRYEQLDRELVSERKNKISLFIMLHFVPSPIGVPVPIVMKIPVIKEARAQISDLKIYYQELIKDCETRVRCMRYNKGRVMDPVSGCVRGANRQFLKE
jgi:hypothetical protein